MVLEAGVCVLPGAVEGCTDGATQLDRAREARLRWRRSIFDVAVGRGDDDMEVVPVAALVGCGIAGNGGAPEDAFDVGGGRWVVAAVTWVDRGITLIEEAEGVAVEDAVTDFLALDGVVGVQVVADRY